MKHEIERGNLKPTNQTEIQNEIRHVARNFYVELTISNVYIVFPFSFFLGPFLRTRTTASSANGSVAGNCTKKEKVDSFVSFKWCLRKLLIFFIFAVKVLLQSVITGI